jgi:hypothetical protein
MRKDHIPALQRELANSAKTVPARHRDTHDLFAEVFDPRVETTIFKTCVTQTASSTVQALTRPRRQ